jgi:hypothetical protein
MKSKISALFIILIQVAMYAVLIALIFNTKWLFSADHVTTTYEILK